MVQIDPKITDDAARVLRPVGTTNKKRGAVAPVYLLRNNSVRYALWQMEEAIARLESIPGVALPFELPAGRPVRRVLNTDLDYTPDFPKVSAHAVAEQCAQIRWHKETGSAGNYDHWLASIGTIKYTIEGEDLAHEWSAVAPGYDFDATQDKLDDVFKNGPARCTTFAACNPAGCQGCKFAGKVTSPLGVGRFGETPVTAYAPEISDEAPATPGDLVAASDVVDSAIVSIDGDPFLRMECGALERIWLSKLELSEDAYFELDAVNHKLLFKILGDGKASDGEAQQPTVEMVSPCLIYPLREVSTADKGAVLLLAKKTKAAKRFTYMHLPVALINEGSSRFKQELGAYGVALHERQGKRMTTFLAQVMQRMGMERESARMTRQYGWQNDSGNMSAVLRAGFAYGDRIYSKGDTGGVIRHASTVDPVLVQALNFGAVSGTLDAWKAAANCYNGPAWAALQSPILFALAAPLVQHLPQLHGSLINYFSPESGVGKTTAIQVALAMYGNPLTLTKRGVDGLTELAACAFMASAGSLPILLDEIGNTDAKRASPIIHAAASGKEKDRLNRSGGQIIGRRWFTPTFASSNESLLDKLTESKAAAQAEFVRTFEIRVPKVLVKADPDARKLLEGVFSNYGHVGMTWIPYVVEHLEEIMGDVAEEEAAMTDRWGMLVEERFHHKLLAAYLVSYRHAKKLGLIQFDAAVVENFAYELLIRSRALRRAAIKSPLQVLFDFMQDAVSSALILDRRPQRENHFQAGYEKPVVLKEPATSRFGMTLMLNNHKGGHGQREAFLSESAVRAYLRNHAVNFNSLIDELVLTTGKSEAQMRDAGSASPVKLRRIELAPSTKFSTGGVRAIYINLDSPAFRAIADVGRGGAPDNVVALHRAMGAEDDELDPTKVG